MQLTKEQVQNLELYARYRTSPPTFWQLFRLNLKRYLLVAALVVILFLLAPTAGVQWPAGLAAGLLLGAILRDVATFWRFVRVWPATAAVLDWERVEALLSDADANARQENG